MKLVLPEMIADRATAVRLYGTHPYGRLINGAPETLAKIDRPDLLLARERFMNPNNATLVCVGVLNRVGHCAPSVNSSACGGAANDRPSHFVNLPRRIRVP
ncbi:MAG: hypothetical protein WKF30_19240 [Pyrinomonadaceae bacterium]